MVLKLRLRFAYSFDFEVYFRSIIDWTLEQVAKLNVLCPGKSMFLGTSK